MTKAELQDLNKEVKREALYLKKLATKQEIDNLEAKTLNPESEHSCIYGQMTGNCWNARSYELISSCATRGYNTIGRSAYPITDNPSCIDPEEDLRGRLIREYMSPIETFIAVYKDQKDKLNIHKLIDYLQDKKKVLDI